MRAGGLSPAAEPRVVFGVRWDGRGRGVVLAAGLIASLLCTLLLASSAAARDRSVPVVVVGKGSAAAVRAARGTVTDRVRLIDGVVAKVPSRSVRAVRRARGVRSVVVDRPFATRSQGDEDDAAALLGETGPATSSVPAEATTLDEVRATIGADRLAAGGEGVDVALIDSGITPVEGLDAPGEIVNGPDFSFDSRNPDLRHLDAFGHGTHLAGIIAGVAPQARLVNVKAANAEGVTSLTQLLLAIDYTVRNRRAYGLDVRVITLAVGADAGAADRRRDRRRRAGAEPARARGDRDGAAGGRAARGRPARAAARDGRAGRDRRLRHRLLVAAHAAAAADRHPRDGAAVRGGRRPRVPDHDPPARPRARRAGGGRGIESQAQLERLRDLGSDMGQGYQLAPPLSGVALLDEPLRQLGFWSEGEHDLTAA